MSTPLEAWVATCPASAAPSSACVVSPRPQLGHIHRHRRTVRSCPPVGGPHADPGIPVPLHLAIALPVALPAHTVPSTSALGRMCGTSLSVRVGGHGAAPLVFVADWNVAGTCGQRAFLGGGWYLHEFSLVTKRQVQIRWLQTTEIYFLTVLETRSPNSRCWQDGFLLGGPEREFILTSPASGEVMDSRRP